MTNTVEITDLMTHRMLGVIKAWIRDGVDINFENAKRALQLTLSQPTALDLYKQILVSKQKLADSYLTYGRAQAIHTGKVIEDQRVKCQVAEADFTEALNALYQYLTYCEKEAMKACHAE